MKPLELVQLATEKLEEFKDDKNLFMFWYGVLINACYRQHYTMQHPVIINEEEC